MTETAQRPATNGTAPDESEGSGAPQMPLDRLKGAAQTLLKAATDKAVGAALEQVEGLTDRLSDVAANGGVGLSSALGGGASMLQGGNPVTGALKAGASKVKDKVTGAIGNVVPGMSGSNDDDEDSDGEDSDGEGGGSGGGGGGARGKFKFMNIFEAEDVGVPLRVVYDQWTQFADFPTFMKKLESVNQESDEKSTWTAKVFLSRRSWDTTIREQVPDSHIIWVSSGAKGYADGCVTFSEIAPNLTRIILVMEYYPQGFFEKTGNVWRAVGRRARLEFKHFCRNVMMDTLINREELEGWRGEIRDSEVVKTHEEAMEEEQAAAEAEAEDGEEYDDAEGSDEELDEGAEDDELAAEDEDDELAASDEDDEDADLEDAEEDDDPAASDEAEDEAEDEADDADDLEDEADDEPEPEPEPEERPRRRRQRQPA